jgi:hypothetical protein
MFPSYHIQGAGLAQYSNGLDGQGSIPGKGNISLLHSIQTGTGAYPASYPMGGYWV